MIQNLSPFTPEYAPAAPPIVPRSALVDSLMSMRTGAPPPSADYSKAFQLSPEAMRALREYLNRPGAADAPQTGGQITQGMIAAGATPDQARMVANASANDGYASGYTQPPPMGLGARLMGLFGLGDTPAPGQGMTATPGLPSEY